MAVRIGVIVGAVAVVARTPDLKPGILAVMALGAVALHHSCTSHSCCGGLKSQE